MFRDFKGRSVDLAFLDMTCHGHRTSGICDELGVRSLSSRWPSPGFPPGQGQPLGAEARSAYGLGSSVEQGLRGLGFVSFAWAEASTHDKP